MISDLLKNRYARQMVLPEIGEQGQAKLANTSVLCVGAGGLGSPALLYLAAAGIGHIGIMDDDVVDESNLQRQILFATSDVGEPKAQVAKKRLLDLNPHIEITAYTERLTDLNCANVVPHYDIVLDGTDNFSSKFLINDAGVKYGKPIVYGAIQGFEGQVSLFNAGGCACYRCLYGEPPTGHVPNCAEAGVIGSVAGMIGTIQALQVIQYSVGQHNVGGGNFESLAGKLWLMDMKTMQSRQLTIPKNPDCPVCSQPAHDIKLQYTAPVCAVVQTLSPAHVMGMQDSIVVLDVREQSEWDAGHIEGAIHHPLSILMDGVLPDIARDADVVVHCQKQIRSEKATALLQQEGYSHVRVLSGGYESWLAQAL